MTVRGARQARQWGRAGVMGLALAPMLLLALLPLTRITITRAAQSLWFATALLCMLTWLWVEARVRKRQLRLLAELLHALREGDYGSRVRSSGRSTFGEVWREYNALAADLGGEQRRGLENDGLLSQLLASLELSILILDQRDRLVDLNPAAEHFLGRPATEIVGRHAKELEISDWLRRTTPFVDRRGFPSGEGPWEVRQLAFRRRGQPHRLIVVTDVSRTLREEERHAWRRLIRVLGHEINNSLGSIQSTANLLTDHYSQAAPRLKSGLELIERRSRALGSFIRKYIELARLPPPTPERVELSELVRHIASMEDRLRVSIESDTSITAYVDPSQFEQALINVIRNAVDAALETGGTVRIRWRAGGRWLLIEVEDDGPGIAQTENLYVPFFTTKPGGSGVGLALARQIMEAHGGTIQLVNRQNARGAIAFLRLPHFQDDSPAGQAPTPA